MIRYTYINRVKKLTPEKIYIIEETHLATIDIEGDITKATVQVSWIKLP